MKTVALSRSNQFVIALSISQFVGTSGRSLNLKTFTLPGVHMRIRLNLFNPVPDDAISRA